MWLDSFLGDNLSRLAVAITSIVAAFTAAYAVKKATEPAKPTPPAPSPGRIGRHPDEHPPGDWVPGIDISSFQLKPDFQKIKDETDKKFIISRASMGNNGKDSEFKRNWEETKTKGFLRGAYHYMIVGTPADAIQQAHNLYSQTGPLNDNDLPPAGDLEFIYNEGKKANVVIPYLLTFAKEYRKLYGRKPLLYTGRGYWDSIGASTAQNEAIGKEFDLWVADYGMNNNSANEPGKVKPFATYIMWQYIGDKGGKLPGFDPVNVRAVDRIRFKGTFSQLLDYINNSKLVA